MKFSDVFPEFEQDGLFVRISMDTEVAKSLSDKEALRYSRLKFERVLKIAKGMKSNDYLYPEFGVNTCPLCAKYFKEDNKDSCKGCPIYKKTGQSGCEGTPYGDEIVEADTVEEYIPALQHEIAFLKELETLTTD